MLPCIRAVKLRGGFLVKLYWDGNGATYKPSLSYKLYDGDTLIFKDSGFSPGAAMAVDSNETIVALLGFLTLKPGDTDREYFDNYTSAQMAWCQSSRCEELSLLVSDYEERKRRR